MTRVEFIAPIRDNRQRDKVLAVLYYEKRYSGMEAMTSEQIGRWLKDARVPKTASINVADVLTKSGHYVETAGRQEGPRLWHLTDSGEQYVRKLLGLPETEPEIEHDVSSLRMLLTKLPDEDVRSYIAEAITCLQAGALRASVVFLWSGAIRTIQQEALGHGVAPLNAALVKHDPKARTVAKVDDFAYIKDSITLLAAQDLGVVDKTQRTILGHGLDLRNSCGHPSKYTLGVKKVSSFVEDVVGIVFT